MQVCTRCIYDETIPYITFDENGVCNYCHQYDVMDKEYPVGELGEAKLREIAAQIKKDGRGKKYDVVIGVSGGCDSSYMLYLAKEKLGLRPLAAHFDNTWNSRIAVENIYNVTKKLDIDLYTNVVNNNEYNDIFKSFLKASVPESDDPADIGLTTTHYMAAEKYGIQYVFQGHSFRTEGVSPQGWVYMDGKYIQSVHKAYGTQKMKTFPNLWITKWLRWMIINRIKMIRPLYYIDYHKEDVKKFLSENFGWKWYGGHHMENRTAYFTNNYYLPKKFNIDLRYCEYAALVRTQQMSRDAALMERKEPAKIDNEIVDEVKSRLGLSDQEFDHIMSAAPRSYRDFKTYKQTFENLKPFFWILYKLKMIPKSFYEKYTKKYVNK